jgi:DNA-binding CsgD family transcriptional regulator/PAS domain-containing protein
MSDPVDKIISAIYDTATVGGGWQSLMSLLARELDAVGATYLVFDKGSRVPEFWCNFGHDNSTEKNYTAQYMSMDPTLDLAIRSDVGAVLHSADHFSSRYIERSEYFQDFLIPSRLGNVAGGKVIDNEDFIGVFSVQQDAYTKNSSDANRLLLDRIMPHLVRASAIHWKLRALNIQHNKIDEALRASPQVTIIVDSGKRIEYLNASAEALIAATCGLAVHAGVLLCSNASAEAQLGAAVRRATDSLPLKGSFVAAQHGEQELYMTVMPLSTSILSTARARPHALIVSAPTLPSCEMFNACFGDKFNLTNAERRLAYRLLGGGTLSEIAVEFGLSRETLRSQVKSIFFKTDINRQAQLLSLMRSVSASMPNRQNSVSFDNLSQ